ncbi:MAG TPA: hypothetical protein PLI43_07170 [Albidovulum sp.]|uniref:hypothetical protein n=1 Tax=Albidovulum sp. TaxID=1872424 RepID=UPI002B5EAE29|nr:hypothetical protein [Albidovulum sp.]
MISRIEAGRLAWCVRVRTLRSLDVGLHHNHSYGEHSEGASLRKVVLTAATVAFIAIVYSFADGGDGGSTTVEFGAGSQKPEQRTDDPISRKDDRDLLLDIFSDNSKYIIDSDHTIDYYDLDEAHIGTLIRDAELGRPSLIWSQTSSTISWNKNCDIKVSVKTILPRLPSGSPSDQGGRSPAKAILQAIEAFEKTRRDFSFHFAYEIKRAKCPSEYQEILGYWVAQESIYGKRVHFGFRGLDGFVKSAN